MWRSLLNPVQEPQLPGEQGVMGTMAGVWAEVSAASCQSHRDPRGWCRGIVEAGRVQAKRATRRGYFRKSGGERTCVSGRAV